MNNNDSKRTDFSDWNIFSKWSIRKITFVAILISISVVFTIIGVQIAPIVAIPTFKISFIGLPVKISGFIFGPLIGFIVGLISDLISFIIIPNIFNPLYTLATTIDGVIAGIVGWLFVKFLKYYFGGEFRYTFLEAEIVKNKHKINDLIIQNEEITPKIKKKIDLLKRKIVFLGEKRKSILINGTKNQLMNINLTTALIILSIISLMIIWLIGFKIDEEILKEGVLSNRVAIILSMLIGYAFMFIFLIIARFKLKPNKYLIIVPIVIFSALIELINVPLLSLADVISFTRGSSDDRKKIFVFIFQHTLFSPVKIWFNMFIIFFTYNIVAPLIYKNDDIYY